MKNSNNCRVSNVSNIKIQSVNSSSVLQVGDSYKLSPFSRAIAVQRQGSIFLGNEGNFNYDIFKEDIPLPDVQETVNTTFINELPTIKAENIYILSLAASSIFHVGNTEIIESEARIKHFRQLFKDNN
jgi:spore germination protein PE